MGIASLERNFSRLGHFEHRLVVCALLPGGADLIDAGAVFERVRIVDDQHFGANPCGRCRLFALPLAIDIDHDYGIVHAHIGLAEAYLAAGDQDHAAEHARKASEVGERNGLRLIAGQIQFVTGQIHWKAGQLTAAKDAWEQARAIFQEIGQLLGEANTLSALARLFDEEGERTAAQACDLRATEIRESLRLA